MSYDSSQLLETYVPIYDSCPEKWEDARQFLTEQLRKVTNGINVRQIGWYIDQELLTGKQFNAGISAANDQQFRSGFRMVINFEGLPNSTTKSVAHNITFDINFTLISLYAGATDPINFVALQIPFASSTLNENIKLTMDATNVNITTAIDYSAYTRCFVVIEYLLEQ